MNGARPAKRARVSAGSGDEGGIGIAHPLRLKPLGNAFFANVPNARIRGLGHLAAFTDEQLGAVLSQLIGAQAQCAHTLAQLAQVSHALHAFAVQDSLWRDAFLLRPDFHATLRFWAGSWRRTYVLHHLRTLDPARAARKAGAAWLTLPSQPITTPDLFSDHLFHTFVHALTPLPPLLPHTKLERVANAIPRISARTHSVASFTEQYAVPNRPCIITDEPGLLPDAPPKERWPCAGWTLDTLAKEWGDERIFRAEAIKCTAKTYLAYARSCGAHCLRAKESSVPIPYFPPPASVELGGKTLKVGAFDPYVVPDESSSYLFDAAFPSTDARARATWRVPSLLATSASGSPTEIDLFALLGAHARPDFRWLIAGPERSGSGWHLDPNGTSAWNTVLSGAKLWLMLPPRCPPPGVYVSEDEAEVTAPASLAEWVALFARATYEVHGTGRGGDGRLLVGMCRAGETCYVPSGWWHAVLNLEETVALTQNFVSPVELPSVLYFLKHKPDQISGFKRPRPAAQGSEGDDIGEVDADADADDEEAAAAASAGPRHQHQHQHPGTHLNGDSNGNVNTYDFRTEIFPTFCARLHDFDPALLARGLEGMRVLEAQAEAQRAAELRGRERGREWGGLVKARGRGKVAASGRARGGMNGHRAGGEGEDNGDGDGDGVGGGEGESRKTWWERLKEGRRGGDDTAGDDVAPTPATEAVANGTEGTEGEAPASFSLGAAVDEDELGEVPW